LFEFCSSSGHEAASDALHAGASNLLAQLIVWIEPTDNVTLGITD
jgi:hypothetical protein